MNPHRVSILILLIAVALTADDAAAQARNKEVKVSGMGTRKCLEWTQWKDTNPESRAMALEWATGFISGHNVYARSSAGTNTVVAGVGVLMPLLDNYCRKNPEERIFSGVVEITRELGGAPVNISPGNPAVPGPRPAERSPRES